MFENGVNGEWKYSILGHSFSVLIERLIEDKPLGAVQMDSFRFKKKLAWQCLAIGFRSVTSEFSCCTVQKGNSRH